MLSEALAGAGGFISGLLLGLMKIVMPTYAELLKENRDLRAELEQSRQRLLEQDDIIEDTEDSLRLHGRAE